MDSGRGARHCRAGFPIRASADHSLFAGSPRLFAGSCALRRLLPPRHPPCALVRLAIQPQPAWPGRTRLLSTSLRFLHSLFFAQALRFPGGSPPRLASAPTRTSQTVKDPPGPRPAGRSSPTRKRTRPCACGSPQPGGTARRIAATLFCFVLFRLASPDDTPGRPASPRTGPREGPWWSQGGSNSRPPACKAGALPAELWPPAGLVGLGGIEPPTSPLSGVRSNQLSYRPEPFPSFRPDNLRRAPALRQAAHFLKGGDPAAGSPTATLLRLHPSHQPHRGRSPPCG